MKFKLDENIPMEAAALLNDAQHDAVTVADQGMSGEQDPRVIDACLDEERVLITLDLDFADVRAYPPEQFHGIMVLRLHRQDRNHVLATLSRILYMFDEDLYRSAYG